VLIISDNLNVSDSQIARALRVRDAGSVREVAHRVTEAGADVIDINLGHMKTGAEDAMGWLVDQVQAVSDLQLSLDSRSLEAMLAGARRAARPPILNPYGLMSSRPGDVIDTLIPFAAEQGLEIVLPAVGESGPSLDVDARAARAQELVGAATAAGVDSARIYVDPAVVHLGGGDGQRHAAAVLEAMRLLAALFDPPLKTIAGVRYVSEGAPLPLRSALNRTFLAMLSALGLNAAIVDVMDGAMMRDIRLIKGLRNESLYSVSDAEL
jgi:5-methyltetrahydrofolate--homocysteine methyltransferase